MQGCRYVPAGETGLGDVFDHLEYFCDLEGVGGVDGMGAFDMGCPDGLLDRREVDKVRPGFGLLGGFCVGWFWGCWGQGEIGGVDVNPTVVSDDGVGW